MKYKNVTLREDFIKAISDSFTGYFKKEENKKTIHHFELLVSEYLDGESRNKTSKDSLLLDKKE